MTLWTQGFAQICLSVFPAIPTRHNTLLWLSFFPFIFFEIFFKPVKLFFEPVVIIVKLSNRKQKLPTLKNMHRQSGQPSNSKLDFFTFKITPSCYVLL
jgi:hypothetical protein